MKLIDIAKQNLEADKSSLPPSDKLRNAGWHNGEWTCAKCGLMIGKNLIGESPFLLARQHAMQCTLKN